MYGSGRNSSFVVQKLIIYHLSFSKDKSIEFQCCLEQDKQQLRPSHIISSITQTQIKHMLPTSLKFRVNPYINTMLSKTRENSRLKTRYLKGITAKQLFIISISRDYSKSPFIQLLKIKLKENLTHLLFCFQNLRSHLNIYITS